MKPLLAVLGVLVLMALAAVAGGYAVDRNVSVNARDLLRDADRLATQPAQDDPLPYFVMHNNLAAAADVESCSAFAVRMTQRFLPDGWEFNADDVAALEAGRSIEVIRLDMGDPPLTRWNC